MFTLFPNKYKMSAIALMTSFGVIGTTLAKPTQEPGRPTVNVKNVELYDSARQRPVTITIWYPAATCSNEHIAQVEICLADKVRTDQTAIISHGAMGAAKNYNWLGYAFASQGIVTVGINHYGESWAYPKDTIDPSSVLQFAQRPLDISFALDQLTNNITSSVNGSANRAIFSKALDWRNTTGLGHSSGGSAVLALIGAQYDFIQARNYCKNTQNSDIDKGCHYIKALTTSPKGRKLTEAEAGSNTDYTDTRIKRAILLDPALGHVSVRQSLEKIATPTLLIASKHNDFLPFKSHSGYYSRYINNVKTTILVQGEGHFVYLDRCKHKHKAVDVPLCTDRPGVDRDTTQQQLYPEIFKFVYRHSITPA